jgi:hypothetical protein
VNDQFVSLLFPAELRAKYALRALEERTGRRGEIVRKGDED